jgi:hypothetical protein
MLKKEIAMNIARIFASVGLAFGLGSSFAFGADTAGVKLGRDTVYASHRAASSVTTQGDYDGLPTFGREGGIPLSKKLATARKRDVHAGGSNLPQRFGRA